MGVLAKIRAGRIVTRFLKGLVVDGLGMSVIKNNASEPHKIDDKGISFGQGKIDRIRLFGFACSLSCISISFVLLTKDIIDLDTFKDLIKIVVKTFIT